MACQSWPICGFIFHFPLCWLSPPLSNSLVGAFSRHGPLSGCWKFGKFIGLRECLPPFIFTSVFLETFWFQGVLLGTLLRSRECVGFSGGCASVRNAPILVIKVHFPFLLFCACFGLVSPFYLYSDLFRSLQYIYENLYCSYSSVCLSSSPRQT